MVENLEHLLRRAARNPFLTREPLFKELMRSETYLLTVDVPLKMGEMKRVTQADATFPIWADSDPEMGGVWVPIFPARDRVREFVIARRLKVPKGKEFLWMGHMPGQIFSLMSGIKRFSGLKLFLDKDTTVLISWPEVRALSEGHMPATAPACYELPIDRLVIPAGVRLSFGVLKPWTGEAKPMLMTMPQAGRFQPEDIRRLVRLPLGDGRHAWTPCRHYFQILHTLKELRGKESKNFFENILTSQLAFEMYGEAEALCDWLSVRGQEPFAWLGLAAIFGRTGRLEDCADLCRQAIMKYPGERRFHINELRALIGLGRHEEAAQRVQVAIQLFPNDSALMEINKGMLALHPQRRR